MFLHTLGSGKKTKITRSFILAWAFNSIFISKEKTVQQKGIDDNLDLMQAKRENFRPGPDNWGPFPHVNSGIFLINHNFESKCHCTYILSWYLKLISVFSIVSDNLCPMMSLWDENIRITLCWLIPSIWNFFFLNFYFIYFIVILVVSVISNAKNKVFVQNIKSL